MAAESPSDPLRRVEALLEVITQAHLGIFARHRRVIDLGRDSERTRDLQREAALIAVHDAPEAVRRVRVAVLDATIGRLLEPTAGDDPDVQAAIGATESALVKMLRRQQAIADQLTQLIERRPQE